MDSIILRASFIGTFMTDKFTKEKRSKIMSKIRSKNTDIEIILKKALEENCIDFEYQPKLFGKPDFLIPPKIAIFCDSSFWHGRNWLELDKKLTKRYWHEHIKRNIERDLFVNEQLTNQHFIVLRFWDFQLKKEIDSCIKKIKDTLYTLNVCD
jgi:DNA mismatch endonuclease (patch repair protein)